LFQSTTFKKIIIISITVIFIASFGAAIPNSTIKTGFAQVNNVPKASLEHNGLSLDLTPLINVKDKIVSRLNFPIDHEDSGLSPYPINKGETVSFEIDNNPSRVDAFLVDYEGDLNTLYALQRTGDSSFIVNSPSPGDYNLEIHVLYPDGRYTSYSKLVDVIDPQMQDLLNLTPISDGCLNTLDLGKVTAIGSPAKLLDNLAIQPLIKEFALGTIDELNIEMPDVKNICGLQLDLANSEKDINFFAIQSSEDGKQFSTPYIFSNTGIGEAPEVYRVPAEIEAKFLKLIPLGSTLEKGLGISDLRLFGK
jgi:hypothetical protein